MTPQETLECCRTAVLKLRQLHAQQEKALPTGGPSEIRARQYDILPAGTNDPISAALQLYDGLKAQAEKLAAEVSRLAQTALPIIMAAPTPRTSVILSHYYLLGLTDQEIAAHQGLSREYVCRERRGALKALR